MNDTALDRAHAAMEADADSDAPRMAFYGTLAETELHLLLESEPEGDRLSPQVFEVDGARYALAFDAAERLAGFAEAIAPYAALPGRMLARMLGQAGLGLGVNLGVAPSSILIPPDAVAWLAETLAIPAPVRVDARAEALSAPVALPEALLRALDAKLARAGGLAKAAWLVGLREAGGRQGHLLVFVDAAPGADNTLARAIAEALVFSRAGADGIDVGFVASGDPVTERLARVGLRFDLPEIAAPTTPTTPGMDPEKPPILK
ncbi:SseB family protein [Roseovarius spongiae]|uniref:SseB family protein n=1 Tax=Roseovarius spongiae TaxID=2320272 RepID=A0A3A8AWP1_9RHOB|nr:SseB family protein [Roseovarius spongiae]RKF14084.1 SseB family protein [Roseovarius spongiae]